MDNKSVITFHCDNEKCGRVMFAEPSQARHVLKCGSCGTNVTVPSLELRPRKDISLLGLYLSRLSSRWILRVNRWQRFTDRIPTGAVVLLWTVIFMSGWLIVAAPDLPFNYRTVLAEIASVREIHRVPYSNSDGSKLLFARTTERGIGIYLQEMGDQGVAATTPYHVDDGRRLQTAGTGAVPGEGNLGGAPRGAGRLPAPRERERIQLLEIDELDLPATGHFLERVGCS